MPETIIDRLFEDNQELIRYLRDKGEVSLQSSADSNFRKTLLLSSASYFEDRISQNLVTIFTDQTNSAGPIVEFLKNKAIARQYHTYFDWESKNANKFFSLFGAEFRSFMVAQVDADPDLQSSIRDFLELGDLRNQLVHRNFATFPLDKTAEEIYELYRSALKFVEEFPLKLREFLNGSQQL